MRRIYNLRNQKGNIALYVLGMLSVIMILFLLVVNLAGVLITKEKSQNTAQQAAMTASSVYYEEVQKAIYEYEDDALVESTLIFFSTVEMLVTDKKNDLSQNPTYNDWSANEIELEAFDQVLNTWLNDLEVRAIILMILSSENIEQKVINEVKSSILKNDGELEDAKLAIHNNRFHVKASNKMKSVNWSDHIDDFEENVFQESSGPKIDFLELLWSGSQVIDLN